MSPIGLWLWGMTGWAQAQVRGNTDLVERIQHDLWYPENWSVWIDLQVLVMTLVPRNPSKA